MRAFGHAELEGRSADADGFAVIKRVARDEDDAVAAAEELVVVKNVRFGGSS